MKAASDSQQPLWRLHSGTVWPTLLRRSIWAVLFADSSASLHLGWVRLIGTSPLATCTLTENSAAYLPFSLLHALLFFPALIPASLRSDLQSPWIFRFFLHHLTPHSALPLLLTGQAAKLDISPFSFRHDAWEIKGSRHVLVCMRRLPGDDPVKTPAILSRD